MFLVKIFFFIISLNAFSQVSEFYTTRLLGTSGAGVASLLINESSILNPASIAFIPVSNAYYQNSKIESSKDSILRSSPSKDGIFEMYQLSDTSSSLKGTLSYQKLHRNSFSREKLVSSMGSIISSKTAMGITYSYNTQSGPIEATEYFHQGSLGITHIVNQKLILGAVLKDPFISKSDESEAIVGLQYSLFKNMLVIQDFSSPLKKQDSHSSGMGSRSALQINFFKDLFLRAGIYKNPMTNKEGNSFGISWVGPKLSLDLARMKSRFYEDTDFNFKGEKEEEASFSVAIRFE